MIAFTDTLHCRERRVCSACEGSRHFRGMLVRAFGPFTCPKVVAVPAPVRAPAPAPARVVVPVTAASATDSAELDRREDLCRACEHIANAIGECGFKGRKPCGCRSRRAWSQRKCPVGKWG